jgi:DNA polymerase-3 subunit gamma/tau
MENFIVSARKYRPSTFKQVVGQESITSTLQNAIKNNHLAQAFLFTGPRGVGKTTCARILAKTINCLNPTSDMEPCNECESCAAFNNNASFNIHELDAASNNSVDDIRNLVDQVRIPPQAGKYKVYIIDEVHMLSQAAFNAFLKTLEEPPEYAKFILATTEKHKILPTILSRCQIFDFKRISVDDIATHLAWVAENENINVDKEALHVIAQKADGALRDALSTFDQIASFSGNTITYKDVIENLNILDYEYYFKIVNYILNGDTSSLLLTFHEILENGFDGQHFITGLSEHFRHLLVVKDVATLKLLEAGPALKEKYRNQSARCTPEFILKALDLTNKCDLSYKASNHKKLHVEIVLIQLSSMQWTQQQQTVQQPSQPQVVHKTAAPVEGVKDSKPSSDTTVAESKAVYRSPVVNKEEPKVEPEIKPEVEPKAEPKVNIVKPVSSTGKKPQNGNGERKISNVSIKSTLDALRSKKEEEEVQEIVIATAFDQEQLEEVWSRFANEYKAKSPTFGSAIEKYKPELADGFKIRMKVDNLIIAKDVLNMAALLEFLKRELNNNQITIEPILPGKKERKVVLTDREKFEAMAKKYPGIKQLKDQLNLELDM